MNEELMLALAADLAREREAHARTRADLAMVLRTATRIVEERDGLHEVVQLLVGKRRAA